MTSQALQAWPEAMLESRLCTDSEGGMMKKLATLLALLPGLAFASPIVDLVTNRGVIEITLDQAHAPKTVANFLAYIKSGHYNGTVFHRVINGFVIQGGGYDAQMVERPHRAPIQNEASNGLKNSTGTIAMARTSDPHSASAQFYINVADNDALNFRSRSAEGWGYAVFGKVTQGMDVVQKIAQTPTGTIKGMSDVPLTPVIVQKVLVRN
jgi:peptidyl-prolyl cis-trans isomerase B (cyclophilin B)